MRKIEELQQQVIMMFTRIMDRLKSTVIEGGEAERLSDLDNWSTPCETNEEFLMMNNLCAADENLKKKLVLFGLVFYHLSYWRSGFHIQFKFISSKPGSGFVDSHNKKTLFDV